MQFLLYIDVLIPRLARFPEFLKFPSAIGSNAGIFPCQAIKINVYRCPQVSDKQPKQVAPLRSWFNLMSAKKRQIVFMRHSVQSKYEKINRAPVYRRTPPTRWLLVLGGLLCLGLIFVNMHLFPKSLLLLTASSIGSVSSLSVTEPSTACSALGDSLKVSDAVVQFSSFIPAGTTITLTGGKRYHLTYTASQI